MMKKVLFVLLALTFVLFSFAACSGNGDSDLAGVWSRDEAPGTLFVFNENGTGELISALHL